MVRKACHAFHFGYETLEDRVVASIGLGSVGDIPFRTHHPTSHGDVGAMVSTATSPSGPVGVRQVPNIVYTTLGGAQHLDLYLPTGPAPAGGYPTILALPGGGWRWVRRSDLGSTVGGLAKYGYVVAVADYAYASSTPGTHIWPVNFDDVQQAVRWLRTNSARYNIDPNRIAAWGESAGGHLASLLGTTPSTATNGDSSSVQAVVDFYGPSDLAGLYNENPRVRSYLGTFLGGSPDQVPDRYTAASPLAHVAPGDPPFFVLQGTADRANLSDQSDRLVAALKAAGVPVRYDLFPNVSHGFRLKLGTNLDLTPEVLTFLDQALNHHGAGVASGP